jgi:endonuclease/exonuclease/phosphatase family metal-dependent hydrolase
MSARHSPPRGWALAAAVPWATWAVLRATGSERGFPLVPALSFTPYAAVTSLLPLAVAVRARSVPAALLAGGSGAVLGGAVLLPARRAGRERPLPPGRRLRVATVSLRRGLVRPGPVLDLVRGSDVDVLAVQELTPRSEAALVAAGLDRLLPHAHVLPARPGRVVSASGAVWSRVPVSLRTEVPGGFEQPTVRLAVPGAPDVEVTSVHTVPPSTSPAAVRGWADDLAALPVPATDVLTVLVGDFNATFDHAALRAVLGLGYEDAARAVGRALTWTWRPLRLRFPRLALDHVLVDPRIAVASVEFLTVRGSDHRAVVVELVLPGR